MEKNFWRHILSFILGSSDSEMIQNTVLAYKYIIHLRKKNTFLTTILFISRIYYINCTYLNDRRNIHWIQTTVFFNFTLFSIFVLGLYSCLFSSVRFCMQQTSVIFAQLKVEKERKQKKWGQNYLWAIQHSCCKYYTHALCGALCMKKNCVCHHWSCFALFFIIFFFFLISLALFIWFWVVLFLANLSLETSIFFPAKTHFLRFIWH